MRNNLISFFIRHPEFFQHLISFHYPFTYNQLLKYKSFIDREKVVNNSSIAWNSEILRLFDNPDDWISLTSNPSTLKTTDLIEEFFDKIEWKNQDQSLFTTISNNTGLPWSIELIEKYEHLWDYYQMSSNNHIPWTENLIDKHLDEWDWMALSGNNSLPWSLSFLNKYSPNIITDNFWFQINPTLTGDFDIVQEYDHFLSWDAISSNTKLPWYEKDLLKLWKNKIDWLGIAGNELLMSNEGFFEKHLNKWLSEEKYFRRLSSNEVLPWTKSFIEKYKDNWDWYFLNLNPKLPWSIELIDSFSDEFYWGEIITRNVELDEYGNLLDYDTFQTYKEHNMGLESNQGIPWSLELIERYEDEIELEMLLMNGSAWEKAFKPFIDDKLINTVIRII